MPSLDSFHDTMREAYIEANRRTSDPAFPDMIIRVEPSRYGGFRVRSIPADLYIDQLVDGPFLPGYGAAGYTVGA